MIFAIVGAVLVPLIMYVAQEVIEGTINSVAARVADALNSIAPSVDIPAVGFDLLLQRRIHRRRADRGPGAAEGHRRRAQFRHGVGAQRLGVRSGQRDSGRPRYAQRGPDGARRSAGPHRPGGVWCPLGSNRPARLQRAVPLRRLPVHLRRAEPGSAGRTGDPQPVRILFGDPFKESKRIYGVRTNEGRWAAVQAVEVTLALIRFRYITWEKALATVQIVGGFDCPTRQFVNFGEVAKPGSAVFVRRGAGRGAGRHGRHATTGSVRFLPRRGARCGAARGGGQGRRPDCRCDPGTAPDRSTHRHVRRRVRVAETPAGPIRRQDSRFRDRPEGRVAAQRHRVARPVAT